MTIARVANSGPFASTFLFLLLGPLALAGAAPSLVAHYALDEGKGNIAHDNTASQYHSVTGGLEWATEGGRTALEFDGKGRCLDCGPGARLGLSDTVTLSLWFFPRAIPPEKNVEYIYEPNPKQVLGGLLPRFVEMQVYHHILESIASEQSARMVAMRNATENANELIEDLTLVYNKARQEMITTELLDITGGAVALE